MMTPSLAPVNTKGLPKSLCTFCTACDSGRSDHRPCRHLMVHRPALALTLFTACKRFLPTCNGRSNNVGGHRSSRCLQCQEWCRNCTKLLVCARREGLWSASSNQSKLWALCCGPCKRIVAYGPEGLHLILKPPERSTMSFAFKSIIPCFIASHKSVLPSPRLNARC